MTAPPPAQPSKRSGDGVPEVLDVFGRVDGNLGAARRRAGMEWDLAATAGNGGADRLLSPDDAAQLLGLSAYTVRQLARERRIPAIRLGRYWRFRRSSLENWITAQERAPR